MALKTQAGGSAGKYEACVRGSAIINHRKENKANLISTPARSGDIVVVARLAGMRRVISRLIARISVSILAES